MNIIIMNNYDTYELMRNGIVSHCGVIHVRLITGNTWSLPSTSPRE